MVIELVIYFYTIKWVIFNKYEKKCELLPISGSLHEGDTNWDLVDPIYHTKRVKLQDV